MGEHVASHQEGTELLRHTFDDLVAASAGHVGELVMGDELAVDGDVPGEAHRSEFGPCHLCGGGLGGRHLHARRKVDEQRPVGGTGWQV